jgi:hypothetical protein
MLDDIKFLAWQDYAGLNLNQKVKPKKKRKMKRQILFRGWSELHNKWVEGNYVVDAIGGSRIVKPDSSGQGLTFIPVHPDSVGQFTALCDMEGNKVFEGDWIRVAPGYSSYIAFKDAMFVSVYTHPEDGEELPLTDIGKFTITGNTFNP